MPEVRKVMQSAAPDGYRLKSLVTAVVLSDNFSMNVVPDSDPAPARTGTAVTERSVTERSARESPAGARESPAEAGGG
jgi:hypothetical protein